MKHSSEDGSRITIEIGRDASKVMRRAAEIMRSNGAEITYEGSSAAPAPDEHEGNVSASQLKAFVERIERLEEEKAGVAGDIKDVYSEAKSSGFNVKAIRKIVSIRKMDQEKRREEEAILEIYMQALGMLADTPLGQAAIERETSRRRKSS